jgi:hypothetical protein
VLSVSELGGQTPKIVSTLLAIDIYSIYANGIGLVGRGQGLAPEDLLPLVYIGVLYTIFLPIFRMPPVFVLIIVASISSWFQKVAPTPTLVSDYLSKEQEGLVSFHTALKIAEALHKPSLAERAERARKAYDETIKEEIDHIIMAIFLLWCYILVLNGYEDSVFAVLYMAGLSDPRWYYCVLIGFWLAIWFLPRLFILTALQKIEYISLDYDLDDEERIEAYPIIERWDKTLLNPFNRKFNPINKP